ncbi:hypothetical protein D3C81_1198310 [compost metagenome]
MPEVFIFIQRKGQRIADDKQKAGKDEVREGKTMPFGMQERRIHAAPVARCIDDDHQGDGQAAQDVEGEVALVHGCAPFRMGARAVPSTCCASPLNSQNMPPRKPLSRM